MSNPAISVIIPVYGVERYIAKCIQSIKGQTFTNFETILVNDGTKDNSIRIAQETIAEDSRFIILHKSNGGIASARNYGLDYAKGDYITFIDSDDFVEPRFLQAMYEKITENNADICVCNARLIDEAGSLEKEFKSNVKLYLKEEDYLNSKFYISNWVWDKMFKAYVFKYMRFDPSIRTFEDAHFIFRLIYGHKITQVHEILYNYVQHKGSTSNDLKPTYLQDRIAVKDAQLAFAKKINITDQVYLQFLYLKTFVFFCSVTFARYSKNYFQDIRTLQAEINFTIFNYKNILLTIKREKRVGLSLLLFKISPAAFRFFVRFWFRNHAA